MQGWLCGGDGGGGEAGDTETTTLTPTVCCQLTDRPSLLTNAARQGAHMRKGCVTVRRSDIFLHYDLPRCHSFILYKLRFFDKVCCQRQNTGVLFILMAKRTEQLLIVLFLFIKDLWLIRKFVKSTRKYGKRV